MFSISCPSCGAKLTSKKPVPAGTRITCPKCQAKFSSGTDGETEGGALSPTPPAPEPTPAKPSGREVRAVEERPSRHARDEADRPSRRSPDADDDRPSRRRRDEYELDDRPRRSRRREDEFDDRDEDRDDFAPPGSVAGPVKGKGMAIAGMVMGIVSIVIAFASGGPFLCSMCCIGFAPISWAVSGSAAVVSGIGLLLSILARSQCYHGPMAVWGIVLNAIALLLSIAGVIILLIFGAALLASLEPGNMPQPKNQPGFNQPGLNQPKNQPNDDKPKQTYPRDHFRNIVMGMTQDNVAFFIGQPDSKRTVGGETTWTYRRITKDGFDGPLDDSAEVIFRDNKVVRVAFNASAVKKR